MAIRSSLFSLSLALLAGWWLPQFCSQAQVTAFSYNGCLKDSQAPATGLYDLSFTVYDAVTNGNAFAALINTNTPVTNGLFTVILDLGSTIQLNGSNYWLEIAARTNGGGDFVVMNPRQPLTSTPYAMYALNAGTATALASNSSPSFTGATFLTNGSAGLVTTSQTNNGAVVFNYNFASWSLGQRQYIFNLAVPTFRPLAIDATMANDYMPNGQPVDIGYGVIWSDWCVQDLIDNNSDPEQTIHLTCHTNYLGIMTYDYSGANVPLPFWLGYSAPGSVNGEQAYVRFTPASKVLALNENGGNLGIGTTNPTSSVTVVNNTDGPNTLALINTNQTGGYSRIQLAQNNNASGLAGPVGLTLNLLNSGWNAGVTGTIYSANSAVVYAGSDLTNGLVFGTEAVAPMKWASGGPYATNIHMVLSPQGNLNVSSNVCASAYTATSAGGFTGNAAGLTNVQASAITGAPTTNIVIGGHTFYITNGIILKVD